MVWTTRANPKNTKIYSDSWSEPNYPPAGKRKKTLISKSYTSKNKKISSPTNTQTFKNSNIFSIPILIKRTKPSSKSKNHPHPQTPQTPPKPNQKLKKKIIIIRVGIGWSSLVWWSNLYRSRWRLVRVRGLNFRGLRVIWRVLWRVLIRRSRVCWIRGRIWRFWRIMMRIWLLHCIKRAVLGYRGTIFWWGFCRRGRMRRRKRLYKIWKK